MTSIRWGATEFYSNLTFVRMINEIDQCETWPKFVYSLAGLACTYKYMVIKQNLSYNKPIIKKKNSMKTTTTLTVQEYKKAKDFTEVHQIYSFN